MIVGGVHYQAKYDLKRSEPKEPAKDEAAKPQTKPANLPQPVQPAVTKVPIQNFHYSQLLGGIKYVSTKKAGPARSGDHDEHGDQDLELMASLVYDKLARAHKADSAEVDAIKLWSEIRDAQFKQYLKDQLAKWFTASPEFFPRNPALNPFATPTQTQFLYFMTTPEGKSALKIVSESSVVSDYFNSIATGTTKDAPRILNR